jgi:hypothetical protein
VEGQGFSPAITTRAERDSSGDQSFSSDINEVREAPSSSVEGQGFSPATKRRREAPSIALLFSQHVFDFSISH